MNKILFFIPRMGGGGSERVMATMANCLSRKYEIKIVTLVTDDSFYRLDNEVELIGLGAKINRKNKVTTITSQFIGLLQSIPKFCHVIKEEQPDVVLSFLGQTNRMALILKMLGLIKCRLVVSERADPYSRKKLEQVIERKLYPKADCIVCQSEAVKRFFYNKDAAHITVIKNPICREAIPPLYEGKRQKKIVSVGRLSEQKNHKLLIRAFTKLNKQYDGYILEIYGEGPQREELERLIVELGAEDKVKLMGAKQNVMHHINDSELFVLSSDFEGFPNALIEAMATGLPVISTDFSPGVAREIVGENNGIVVPLNDVQSLTNAIEAMLGDKKRIQIASHENRRMLDELAEDLIAQKWEKVLMG